MEPRGTADQWGGPVPYPVGSLLQCSAVQDSAGQCSVHGPQERPRAPCTTRAPQATRASHTTPPVYVPAHVHTWCTCTTRAARAARCGGPPSPPARAHGLRHLLPGKNPLPRRRGPGSRPVFGARCVLVHVEALVLGSCCEAPPTPPLEVSSTLVPVPVSTRAAGVVPLLTVRQRPPSQPALAVVVVCRPVPVVR